MRFCQRPDEKTGRHLQQLPGKVQCLRHQEEILHLIISKQASLKFLNLTLLPRPTPIVSAEVTSDKKSNSPPVEYKLTSAVCWSHYE